MRDPDLIPTPFEFIGGVLLIPVVLFIGWNEWRQSQKRQRRRTGHE
ncbi:hypothetical protein [Gordonia insulae]|jgi:predicted negative regulator of RcsB-dependent stress response|uniref:Uncharacterized protein n=1 Tax=Gordonia insulae TaxID=2420509 RepID=A0A3G8JEQ7_9ACTN|nr:hypothetical protein [Gordonia insulae]AZG43474.1 hypothetical protein D7316_00039 [Gordonia insulae]